MGGATITFDSVASKFELLDYPGGIGVYGATASIDKTSPDDSNDYQATFNLKITYKNQTGTDLNWELYMLDSAISNLDAEKTTICELKQLTDNSSNETKYWYQDKNAGDNPSNEGCTASAITGKLSEDGATKIASGILKTGEENGTITKATEPGDEYTAGDTDLTKRTINTSDKKAKYYYLVVKYPNKNDNQAKTDAGKDINVTLSLDGTPTSTLYKPAE